MSLLLDDILAFLTSEGLIGGATGWTGAANFLPPDPDQVVCIFETGGVANPELPPDGSTEVLYDEPTFQVRGRGSRYGMEALRTKMGAVYRALHGGDLGSDYVDTFALNGGPLALGLDDNSRPGLTWNFRTMRRRDADS